MGMEEDRYKKGAWAELIACTWLIEQGYEVFRNVCDHGPVDVVAVDLKSREVALFDVKYVATEAKYNGGVYIKGGDSRLTDRQHNLGIVPIFVTHEGVCAFSVKNLRKLYADTRRVGATDRRFADKKHDA